MRWQRRFDCAERREVLELVLTEGEAEDLSGMADIRLPRKPKPRRDLAAVIGKWPGEETDQQIQEALDALHRPAANLTGPTNAVEFVIFGSPKSGRLLRHVRRPGLLRATLCGKQILQTDYRGKASPADIRLECVKPICPKCAKALTKEARDADQAG